MSAVEQAGLRPFPSLRKRLALLVLPAENARVSGDPVIELKLAASHLAVTHEAREWASFAP